MNVMVNTACDRDDTGFIKVAATERNLSPANISSAISSYDVTDLVLSPSTNGPVAGCSRTRRVRRQVVFGNGGWAAASSPEALRVF